MSGEAYGFDNTPVDGEPEGVEDLLLVHIGQERPYRELALLTIDNPEPPWSGDAEVDRRHLALTEGVPEDLDGDSFLPDGDRAVSIYMQGREQRVVVRSHEHAVAYFLHAVETNVWAEDEPYSGFSFKRACASVRNALADHDAAWYLDDYLEWRHGFSDRDRRLRLLDLLDERVGTDPVAAHYQDAGTWRSVGGLDDDQEHVARSLVSSLDPPAHPRLCYNVAQRATLAADERGLDRVEYAEGIALPHTLDQAIRHAWIEIDGVVAELTWPWHRFDAASAVYFGETVAPKRLREKRNQRGGRHFAAAISDDVYQEYADAMGVEP